MGSPNKSVMRGGRSVTGIREIASYIPAGRTSNYARKEQFRIDDAFIEQKIGVRAVALKAASERTSDLCVKAYENLCRKIPLAPDDIGALVVITQNPDMKIPHTSAIVQGRLGIGTQCACFDISLGCSGFVYGLSILQSFMKEHGMRSGLLFTADPYSGIVDPLDKNTALLFGDGASVTLVSEEPRFVTVATSFGTMGSHFRELQCEHSRLEMNGRAVLEFILRSVPDDIHALLKRSTIDIDAIDRFIFHQGSKYIVDMLTKRLRIDKNRVAFDILDYGNTVSSSIPLILEKELGDPANATILISGFGTGLSWSTSILKRN